MTVMEGELEAASREVETDRVAVLLEQTQVCASAASAIEQPRPREARRCLFEQRADEAPESPVPEVSLLDIGRGLEQTIHGVDSTRPDFHSKTHNVALTASLIARYSGHEVPWLGSFSTRTGECR